MSVSTGLALRFLGVGGAQAIDLGNAAAVIEKDQQPMLLIDCGPTVPGAYLHRYQVLPAAVFITHLHLDHIGGLEALYYRARFGGMGVMPKLYVPATLVAALHARVAEFPGLLAEGGGNFWDVLHLVPVGSGFWCNGYWFDVHAVRHHAPLTAWALQLRGHLFYTGDTRPIPELIRHLACHGERLFHDVAVQGNPSHAGLEDLLREYTAAERARMVVYHYGQAEDVQRLQEAGLQPACVNEVYPL